MSDESFETPITLANKPDKTIKIKPQSKRKKREIDIYSNAILTKQIYIPIVNVGSNIKLTLQQVIAKEIEGKCISEGYIKPESVDVISYSSGVVRVSDILFDVVYQCKVCCPVDGMSINCVAKNITKAGIRAELEGDSPVVIFVARDHNYLSSKFSSIQENQTIRIKVIGQRYELYDTYISIIGELEDDIALVQTAGKKNTK